MNLFENLNIYKTSIKKEATEMFTDEDFRNAGYVFNNNDYCWYYPKIYKKGNNEYQLMYTEDSGLFIVYNKTLLDNPETHDSYGPGDNLAMWDYRDVGITQAIQKFKELFNGKENLDVESDIIGSRIQSLKNLIKQVEAFPEDTIISNHTSKFRFEDYEKEIILSVLNQLLNSLTNGNVYEENVESLNENKLIDNIKDFITKLKNDFKSKKDDKNIKNILSKIESNGNDLNAFFDELVPSSGSAETKAGEIIRAMMRISYRWWNDGDYFFDGYGLETCGPAAAYLSKIDESFKSKITHIIDSSALDTGKSYEEKYEKEINELQNDVINYILNNPNLLMESNNDDCLNTSTKWIEDFAPTYEIDIDLYDDLGEFVDDGYLTWKEIESDIETWDIVRNHELEGSNGSYVVYGLSYSEYEELSDSIPIWIRDMAHDYAEEFGEGEE